MCISLKANNYRWASFIENHFFHTLFHTHRTKRNAPHAIISVESGIASPTWNYSIQPFRGHARTSKRGPVAFPLVTEREWEGLTVKKRLRRDTWQPATSFPPRNRSELSTVRCDDTRVGHISQRIVVVVVVFPAI